MVQKVALITGCSEPTSLGAAFALVLLGRGWKVFATARKVGTLQNLKDAGCEVIALDVTDQASVDRAAAFVGGITNSKLDLLINNAGVAALGPTLDLDVEQVKRLYDVNVFGVIRVTQAFTPLLINATLDSGQSNEKSRIINIASASAFMPPWQGAYGSSKAAVIALSNSMRVELDRLGVNVIIVHLVLAKTAMLASQKPFDILKSQPSGYYPWINTIQPQTSAEQAKHNETASPPETVAKQILDSALVKSPKGEIYAGTGGWIIKWVVPYLPRWLFDQMVAKIGHLDLIPSPRKTQ